MGSGGSGRQHSPPGGTRHYRPPPSHPQLWAWPDRAHTQDTQREACGILWGFPFPAPAREGMRGGGLWQCSQQKLLPS